MIQSSVRNSRYYRSLKTRRIFSGKHAKSVALVDNNIIKKVYSKQTADIFKNEVDVLKKLQKLNFVPRLYFVDKDKFTIYMSYCGLTVKNLERYKPLIKKYQKIIQKNYGLYHNDIRVGNVCFDSKNNQLYLIDFGWTRTYKGEGGYGKGRIGDKETTLKVQENINKNLLTNIDEKLEISSSKDKNNKTSRNKKTNGDKNKTTTSKKEKIISSRTENRNKTIDRTTKNKTDQFLLVEKKEMLDLLKNIYYCENQEEDKVLREQIRNILLRCHYLDKEKEIKKMVMNDNFNNLVNHNLSSPYLYGAINNKASYNNLR